MSRMTSIAETIGATIPDLPDEQKDLLAQALVAREDDMADYFRLAGIQFGLYPWIMAEVFADIGIGSPVEETQRQMIRAQFVQGMEELRRQMGGGGDGASH